jgi:localization factor PodJL
MARASSQFQPHEYGQPAPGEWQDLRSELVALLDQVETQVSRARQPEAGLESLAERMRDLRHQVTSVEPDNRHREALRSVQRAIDRFSDRDEALGAGISTGTSRDTLESAIQQIRSRHFSQAQASEPMARAPEAAPRFDELARAVGGISERLERLEGELRVQSKGQTANVKEIADQVGQLSHVVELLAGAVGETGQVKRLEGQIAGLAKLITQGPQVDVETLTRRLDDVASTVGRLADLQVQSAAKSDTSGLNQRLDDVSATVARLAELQMQYASRADTTGLTQRFDDVTATVGRLADLQVEFVNRVDSNKVAAEGELKSGMTAIEAGVRNIYDRIDAIEQAVALPAAEIDRITEQLGKIAAAMKAPQQQPQGLIELIDALNVRISDMENHSPEVGGLQFDVDALRSAVTNAIEPRFAALEQKLGDLSDKVGERPAEISTAQLEAQVRQLVARMDQTGEQLTGLAKLYSQPAGPDLSGLADLVALRTSEVVARAEALTAPVFGEPEYAEIEKRVSRIMATAAKESPGEDISALNSTIREVSERLQRIEASLMQPAAASSATLSTAAVVAPLATPVAEPVIDTEDPLAPLLDWIESEEATSMPMVAAPALGRDAMPANPAQDAPLRDKPFGDPPSQAFIPDPFAAPRPRHPGLDDTNAVAAAPARPVFDPASIERPPQPRSSLEQVVESFAAAAPVAPSVTPAEDIPPPPSRSTFIEAHRRAVRQTSGSKPIVAAAENTLIGKAFARFNATRLAAEAKPVEPVPAPPPVAPKGKAEKPAKPVKDKPVKEKLVKEKPAKPQRKLAGDKASPTTWQPDSESARVLPTAPEPSTVALGEDDLLRSADTAAKPTSFLLRHKQPILLAASVLALACLTINLINQRMTEQAQTASEETKPLTVGDAALTATPMAEQASAVASAPRQIPMVDTLTTGSIDPSAAQGFVPAAKMPALNSAFVAATEVAAADPNATEVASLSDEVEALPGALESPVQVEVPPEALGPDSLRKAAAGGDARAQFEIAAIYTEGRAVPEDLKSAAIWYERAGIQGFAPAQYRLGNLYENGNGVEKDLAQARLWYQRAAEAGNRMAMHNLAALYAGGGLGTQQFDAAAKWFEEAANRGMKDSQFNLGMLYARGLGVPQNLEVSYKWFSLAAAKGDKDAAKARDDIAASLDARTVQRLNGEIAAWKPMGIDLVANFAPIGTWTKNFDPGATIATVAVVKGVQTVLGLLGYDVGVPDGVAGPKTADAIRAFEHATGMNETGTVNPRLLAVLGSQPV